MGWEGGGGKGVSVKPFSKPASKLPTMSIFA